MKPRVFESLPDLVAALGDIRPRTLDWEEHLGTDRRQWKIHVPTCADLEKLTVDWGGRREDRGSPEWHGTVRKYADIGPGKLIEHVCIRGTACWSSDPASDYDTDLFGGIAS